MEQDTISKNYGPFKMANAVLIIAPLQTLICRVSLFLLQSKDAGSIQKKIREGGTLHKFERIPSQYQGHGFRLLITEISLFVILPVPLSRR